MKLVLDNLTEDPEGYIVYVHLIDDVTGNALDTTSIVWSNKADFKFKLKKKLQTAVTKHNAKEAKRIEVSQALTELEKEILS